MCTSGCKTKDHATYGECLRANKPVVRNPSQSASPDYLRNYMNDLEIREYRAARAQGIQPKGTKLTDTRYAVEASKRADEALTIT